MANLRDVRLRMRSIGQTLQVTKAMNLISTAKLRSGRRLLEDTEPYFTRVQKTMSDILASPGPKLESGYFRHDKEGRTAIVVVTTDKGLAGGYNANVAHYAAKLCEGVSNPVLILIGTVGQRYFVQSPWMVLENFTFNSRLPDMEEGREVAEYVTSQFEWGVFSEVRVVYTHMYSTLKLLPQERRLLPLDSTTMFVRPETAHKEEPVFEYVPSAEAVFNALAPIYIQGVLYGCLVESYAAEQSARMTAMDQASRNCSDMLSEQTLFYNRVRQAGITQEVTEIVSGSAALGE
jgi:F-type H+-transporting ATPase subunit gamma